MKGLIIAVASMTLAGAAVMAAAAPRPDAKQVHARGCVQAAAEGRCIVLKDVESGRFYNLLIKGAGPEIGTGIEFTGTPYSGATSCMQGDPVLVTSWTRKDYLKCSTGKSKSVQ